MTSDVWQQAKTFLAQRFGIEPLSFIAIVLFVVSFLLFLVCMPALCCAGRRYCNGKSGAKRKTTAISEHDPERRRLLGLMLANLEEFDTLTPLIVSPSASGTGSSSSASKSGSRRHLIPPKPRSANPSKDTSRLKSSIATDSAISVSRDDRSRQLNYTLTTSDSPPPPRRAVGGKTLIVPLTCHNNRAPTVRIPIGPPLLGTPDSRITSFEAGTTKSCATIPEDEEFESDDVDETAEEERTHSADLLSIDRTYMSNKEPAGSQFMRPPISRPLASNWTTSVHATVPEFKLPPPTYSPPTPPFSNSPIRRVNLRPPSSIHRATTSTGGNGTESPQSNLSSPEDSSCGMATSPVDTTGSLSDSFMMPNEMEAVRMYYAEAAERAGLSASAGVGADASSIETDRKFALHRIEEESENEDPSGSRVMMGSIASSDSKKGGQADLRRIPRSISQQLSQEYWRHA